MKTSHPLRHSVFRQESGAHTVKVIKADQAIKMLQAEGKALCAPGPEGYRKNAEIRLVGTGLDYCDLEVICGCGDVTRFRAWNTVAAEEKGAK
jgi:hypothetical protein